MNLLHLVTIIEHECQMAKKYRTFGTDDFHIEKVERLEDINGSYNFKVTTYNRQKEESREEKEMSLFELMDLLGRVIAHRGINPTVDLIENTRYNTNLQETA